VRIAQTSYMVVHREVVKKKKDARPPMQRPRRLGAPGARSLARGTLGTLDLGKRNSG